eukprot:5118289-Prymnesium_polylepis.1
MQSSIEALASPASVAHGSVHRGFPWCECRRRTRAAVDPVGRVDHAAGMGALRDANAGERADGIEDLPAHAEPHLVRARRPPRRERFGRVVRAERRERERYVVVLLVDESKVAQRAAAHGGDHNVVTHSEFAVGDFVQRVQEGKAVQDGGDGAAAQRDASGARCRRYRCDGDRVAVGSAVALQRRARLQSRVRRQSRVRCGREESGDGAQHIYVGEIKALSLSVSSQIGSCPSPVVTFP